MKIEPIFTSDPPEQGFLFAIVYDEEPFGEQNVVDYYRTFWIDAFQLKQFFLRRRTQLDNEQWKKWDVLSAVRQVRKEAFDFFRLLLKIEKDPEILHDYFHPLTKIERGRDPFAYKRKAWRSRNRPLLRLYGIKLADGKFLLTGGGIKLTKTMQEDSLLAIELSRIERVKKFLKAEGINYIDDYFLSSSK